MKFSLIITLLLLSLTSQAQTVCFENEKVKMRDVIDLEEQNVSRPTSDKVAKLAAAQKDAVKETKVMGYSLNSEPKEDIKVNYYKNSAGEDVAVFKYNGQKYYKVRNLQKGCTAIYANDSASKKFLLLASLLADSNDNFFSLLGHICKASSLWGLCFRKLVCCLIKSFCLKNIIQGIHSDPYS